MLKEQLAAVAQAVQQPHPAQAFDGFDLVGVHFWSCVLGSVLCAVVMQLVASGTLRFPNECVISYWARRTSLVILGLSMCWAAIYATEKSWQPWPPDLAIILSIDLLLGASVLIAIRREMAQKRESSKPLAGA